MVAASQVSAVAALQAIAEAGLSVPDDVALATFDDFPFADLFSPRLTAVSQPAFAIGRDAVRLLLRRLKTPAAPPRTIRLRPRIVHRESCGCGGREPIEWNDGHLDADEVATAQAALATTGPPRSQGR
jgi:LacI family transcriptional regulator